MIIDVQDRVDNLIHKVEGLQRHQTRKGVFG